MRTTHVCYNCPVTTHISVSETCSLYFHHHSVSLKQFQIRLFKYKLEPNKDIINKNYKSCQGSLNSHYNSNEPTLRNFTNCNHKSHIKSLDISKNINWRFYGNSLPFQASEYSYCLVTIRYSIINKHFISVCVRGNPVISRALTRVNYRN